MVCSMEDITILENGIELQESIKQVEYGRKEKDRIMSLKKTW